MLALAEAIEQGLVEGFEAVMLGRGRRVHVLDSAGTPLCGTPSGDQLGLPAFSDSMCEWCLGALTARRQFVAAHGRAEASVDFERWWATGELPYVAGLH